MVYTLDNLGFGSSRHRTYVQMFSKAYLKQTAMKAVCI
jgi:hypothetical protein